MSNKFNKNKTRIIILLLITFLLTGCTTSLTNKKGDVVVNNETETSVIENIVCKPTSSNLQELYRENGKSLLELEDCDNIKVFKWRGIWDTFFIYPVSFLVIKTGKLFGNFVWAIILLAFFARLFEYSSSKKIAKQNAILKKIQPEIDAINEKFKDRNDSASMIEKGDALKAIYLKNNIKPMTGIFTSFMQLPILISLIESLYRIPILSESTFLTMNLAMSPMNGIKNGNMVYLILSVMLIVLAFIQSIIKTDGKKIKKRDIIMSIIIVWMVSSFVFSLPSGIAIYFFTSYLLGIVQKIIIRCKLSNNQKTSKID